MKEPDSATDKALRWGQYVVEHFDPAPGSMVLITYDGTASSKAKAEQMADALESALDKDNRRDDVVIGTAPHSYAIRELPSEKMNPCGWYHSSQLSKEERDRLEENTASS